MIVKWVVVGWIALGAVSAIALVGKPRKPITPASAAIGTMINTVYIIAIILAWHS